MGVSGFARRVEIKCESGDEIMARNKDSKNQLKLTAKTRADHETEVGTADHDE